MIFNCRGAHGNQQLVFALSNWFWKIRVLWYFAFMIDYCCLHIDYCINQSYILRCQPAITVVFKFKLISIFGELIFYEAKMNYGDCYRVSITSLYPLPMGIDTPFTSTYSAV